MHRLYYCIDYVVTNSEQTKRNATKFIVYKLTICNKLYMEYQPVYGTRIGLSFGLI